MSQLPEAVLKLIELSEKATHGAELLPVKTVKCSCGHPKCTYYGLNDGSFLQGCGWDKPTAELYAALVNWFRSNGPQELFEAGRSSMREEAAKVCDEIANFRARHRDASPQGIVAATFNGGMEAAGQCAAVIRNLP